MNQKWLHCRPYVLIYAPLDKIKKVLLKCCCSWICGLLVRRHHIDGVEHSESVEVRIVNATSKNDICESSCRCKFELTQKDGCVQLRLLLSIPCCSSDFCDIVQDNWPEFCQKIKKLAEAL